MQEQQDKQEWLDERTILLAQLGSHAYGTNNNESDVDIKGIVIPPVNYFLGLNCFNEYNNSGGRNFTKNTKDDVDINLIHINKFVRDAMSGSLNIIEMLFIQKEKYLKLTKSGQLLIDNRHLFLTKAIKDKFAGYAKKQSLKINSLDKGRIDLIEKFGYDTKSFMHAIRIQTSAIEIATTCDFSTFRSNREFLLKCRNGEFSLTEALQMIEHYDELMKTSIEKSSLPERPDHDKINELLVQINKQSILLGEI